MKKLTILVLTLSLVGIMAFGFAATANAEEITPVYPGNGAGGNGNGGNGRGGSGTGTGVPMNMNINLDGILHETMAAAIADGLGISVETLKAREDAGETLVEIGISLGFDAQAVLDLHKEARIAALNQAVADGLITAEQATWMISRLDNGQFGLSSGTCTEDPATCTQMTQRKYQKHMRGGRFATEQ
jgi:nitrite reductase/ring-hydroxylating ferredoxin subunit